MGNMFLLPIFGAQFQISNSAQKYVSFTCVKWIDEAGRL